MLRKHLGRALLGLFTVAVLQACDSATTLQPPLEKPIVGRSTLALSTTATEDQEVPWIDNEAEFYADDGTHYYLVRHLDAHGQVVRLDMYQNSAFAYIDVARVGAQIAEYRITDPSTQDYAIADAEGHYLRSRLDDEGATPPPGDDDDKCNKHEDDGLPCDGLMEGECQRERDKVEDHLVFGVSAIGTGGAMLLSPLSSFAPAPAAFGMANIFSAAFWHGRLTRCRQAEAEVGSLAWQVGNLALGVRPVVPNASSGHLNPWTSSVVPGVIGAC